MTGEPSLQVRDAAFAWSEAGASGIPIRPGGTKRPATKWEPFQATAPTWEDTTTWFGNGHHYGLAVIMGAVSGNLEMTEIEGIAVNDMVLYNRIFDELDNHDAFDLWHVLHNGYLEQSPSGGLHFIYRIEDHPVPGNEKIARRPATPEELETRPTDKIKVLAETRGEGGYVIVAPTSGLCHPTGEAWKLLAGAPGVVPTITWEQRNLFHKVLRVALDAMSPEPSREMATVPQLPLPINRPASHSGQGLSPGDAFEGQTDWAQILEPHGWATVHGAPGGEQHWVRPGKDRREGMSATTGRAHDRDRLYVFSTSTEFEAEVPYTKFGAYALLNFGGDHSAAARELARMGYGDRPVAYGDDGMMESAAGVKALPSAQQDKPQQRPRTFYRYDDDGNAMRLWDVVRDQSRYVKEYNDFMTFNGQMWVEDYKGASLHRAFMQVKERMYQEADANDDEALGKWAAKCGMEGRRNAAVSTMRWLDGVTVDADDFDTNPDLVNVGNGVLNPRTGELVDHDAKYLMTRTFGADYDPQATAPTWDKYLSDVLPDPRMRAYVQRAMGYTLLGEPNRRSIFFVHGPGGTGKSTFMEVMQGLFGDYGTTAAPGTFRAKSGDGPTNDLHGLRGKRFVSTSETTDSTSFEEDLLKRLAGNDTIVSRNLYERNQTWKPECVLWLATNHPPKFNSDDDAIWQRTKLIPFMTPLSGTSKEVPNMTKVLLAEAAGILNWILAGLADFDANGLGEPEAVREAASDQRSQSDPVARFLADKVDTGTLKVDPEETIQYSRLHAMYVEWARACGERALTFRRFNHRMAANPRMSSKKSGQMFWVGVGAGQGASVLGTMLAIPGT